MGTETKKPLLEDDFETKPLTVVNQHNELNSFKVWAFSTTGLWLTKGAMWGQGIFAALLTAKLLKNTGPARTPLTLVLGSLVGYASYLGKYVLVWFYGQDRWCRDYPSQSLAQLCNQLNPMEWRLNDDKDTFIPGFINYPVGFLIRVISLVMAYIFWGLTIVSLGESSGAAALARDLNWNWGADHIFTSLLLNVALSLAAFISNVTSWSIIIQLGYLNIITILSDFGRIFIPKINDQQEITATSFYFTHLINNQKKLGLSGEIEKITTLFDQSPLTTRSNLLGYYNQHTSVINQHKIAQPYFHHRLFHWLLAAFAVSINVYGFLNFKDMPRIIQGDLPAFMHLPDIALNVLGYMSYTAMLLLGTSVYQPTKELAQLITGHSQPVLHYYSQGKRRFNNAWAIFMGVIGGAPNLYQTIIADQDTFTLSAAAIGSSLMVELPTLLAIYHQQAQQQAFKKEPELRKIETIVGLFQHVIDTPHEQLSKKDDAFAAKVSELDTRSYIPPSPSVV